MSFSYCLSCGCEVCRIFCIFVAYNLIYSNMKIENVNIGVCERRVQEGKPSFFVNWLEDGQQKYEFFKMRFDCEIKNRELARINEGVLHCTCNTTKEQILNFVNLYKGEILMVNYDENMQNSWGDDYFDRWDTSNEKKFESLLKFIETHYIHEIKVIKQ